MHYWLEDSWSLKLEAAQTSVSARARCKARLQFYYGTRRYIKNFMSATPTCKRALMENNVLSLVKALASSFHDSYKNLQKWYIVVQLIHERKKRNHVIKKLRFGFYTQPKICKYCYLPLVGLNLSPVLNLHTTSIYLEV